MQARNLLGVSVATAALAGLLFGFDTAVVAGVTGDLVRVFDLTPASLGLTVSSALWGTLLGALLIGSPGDRFGSRNALRVLALFYIVSGVGSAIAWDWGSLIFFRFIGGIAIGGSSVLAPVYISEIAPPARRGALVGMFQFNVVLGILVAYLSNGVIGALLDGSEVWRWKLGAAAAPAVVLLVLLYRIPNSPRWLAAKQRGAEAAEVLANIGIADPRGELKQIERSLAEERSHAGVKLSWARHGKPILLAFGLASFNQLAGINAILYYLNDIFAAAGYGAVSADRQAVAIGVANLLFTALGMMLIDRVGRKTLLLVGAAGMTACLSVVAVVLFGHLPEALLLWMLIGFIAFFAVSQGAVIWVYLSEIFPTSVRARGAALGSTTHWLWNALISGVFPAVAAVSRGAPFLFFAGMMALQFVLVLIFFPETRGVALEEMEERLGGSRDTAGAGGAPAGTTATVSA